MADSRKTAAVIGGGWAGCSAAVELARAGFKVTLFEAARTLGGRARLVEMQGAQLDNGQHILLGAYAETLRMLALVGVDPARALLTLPRWELAGTPYNYRGSNLQDRGPSSLHVRFPKN